MPNWPKVIAGLKKLVDDVGAFWPKSTPLAGYAEDGPYHCEDCTFLKGKLEGKIFVDEKGKGRCPHPAMLADPKVKKDKDGIAIVAINKGCCEFVDQIPDKPGEPEGLVQIEGLTGNDMAKKKHPFSHTIVEHHGDNTHTYHHVNEKNKFSSPVAAEGDVRGAAGSHDDLIAKLKENLVSAPGPEVGEPGGGSAPMAKPDMASKV